MVKRRRNENEEKENKYARTWTKEEKRQIKNEEKTKDFIVTLATCGTYKGKKVKNKRTKGRREVWEDIALKEEN